MSVVDVAADAVECDICGARSRLTIKQDYGMHGFGLASETRRAALADGFRQIGSTAKPKDLCRDCLRAAAEKYNGLRVGKGDGAE